MISITMSPEQFKKTNLKLYCTIHIGEAQYHVISITHKSGGGFEIDCRNYE